MAKKSAADVAESIRAEVTERVIEALERFNNGEVSKWMSGLRYRVDPRPRNAVTNRPYRGVNLFICMIVMMTRGYQSNRWLTYDQAKALGATPKDSLKGQGVRLTYPIPVFKRLDTDEIIKSSEKKKLLSQGVKIGIAYFRGPYMTKALFNVDLFNDLSNKIKFGTDKSPDELDEHFDHEEQAQQVQKIVDQLGVEFTHANGTPCYVPSLDRVSVPEPKFFESQGHYLSTTLHECAHATGHESRLKRDMSGGFGSKEYAREELVAEMCSAFVCAALGIDGKLQHPEYLHGWLKKLDHDTKEVFKAAALAEKAMTFLMGDMLEELEIREEELETA